VSSSANTICVTGNCLGNSKTPITSAKYVCQRFKQPSNQRLDQLERSYVMVFFVHFNTGKTAITTGNVLIGTAFKFYVSSGLQNSNVVSSLKSRSYHETAYSVFFLLHTFSTAAGEQQN
jgi:hypothetical protein